MDRGKTIQVSHHLDENIVHALRLYALENKLTQRMVIERALEKMIPREYYRTEKK